MEAIERVILPSVKSGNYKLIYKIITILQPFLFCAHSDTVLEQFFNIIGLFLSKQLIPFLIQTFGIHLIHLFSLGFRLSEKSHSFNENMKRFYDLLKKADQGIENSPFQISSNILESFSNLEKIKAESKYIELFDKFVQTNCSLFYKTIFESLNTPCFTTIIEHFIIPRILSFRDIINLKLQKWKKQENRKIVEVGIN
jgi:hypothetical protein